MVLVVYVEEVLPLFPFSLGYSNSTSWGIPFLIPCDSLWISNLCTPVIAIGVQLMTDQNIASSWPQKLVQGKLYDFKLYRLESHLTLYIGTKGKIFIFPSNHKLLKKCDPSPDRYGSVGWTWSHKAKGRQLDSQSWHFPVSQAQSLVGCIGETTNWWCFSPSLTALPSPISKIK